MQFDSPGDRVLAMKVAAYTQTLDDLRLQAGLDYQVVDRPARWFSWIYFRRPAVPLPAQGWKVHFSCASDEASDMLRLAVRQLLRMGATAFKVPSSLQGILTVNSEMAGPTQAGKILTVYPRSDEELSKIVSELGAVWQSVRGPQILSDLPVASNSSIYLRYGGFYTASDSYDALGRAILDVRGPLGPQSDRRSLNGEQPAWAPSPPVQVASVRYHHPSVEPDFAIQGDIYLGLQRLNSGLRVDVSLALRKRDLDLVVAKRARRGVMGDVLGGDAVTRLRNEYLTLTALAGTKVNCPAPLAFEEDENGANQIQSFIEGIVLTALPCQEALCRLENLSSMLQRLHSLNIVHRDVKLSNAMAQQESIYLLDFELAAPVGQLLPIPGGTPGYIPPEGAYAPASTYADIYSFGATLFEAAMGVSPARLPSANTRGRLIGLLNLSGQQSIGRLVRRLTELDPLQRMPLHEAEESLRELRQREGATSMRSRTKSRPSKRLRRFSIAGPLAAGLVTRSYAQDDPKGRAWRNAHLHVGYMCEGLNIGNAGIMLGLASLDTALGTTLFSDDLHEGARWLASALPSAAAQGLFTGNAGVALTLGVIAKRLDNSCLDRAARQRLAAAGMQDGDYDLFSGAAGILWAGCLLSEVLQSDWPLKLVAAQAEKLIANAKIIGKVTCWPSSPLFNSSRQSYFGAAHGAAGVAMALAAWSRTSGCQVSGQIAQATFEALLLTVRQHPDRALPEGPGRPPRPVSHWCHGTAGLLWCVLQSDEHAILFRDLVSDCASDLINRPTLVSNPTYCHGLAGQLELMRMMHSLGVQAPEALQLRLRYSQALRLLYQRRAVGGVWSSEHPWDITPDLWVGFLGPAVSLALEGVDARGSVFSASWLAKCASPPRAVVKGNE